jgi:hypothetical protein
MERSTNNYQKCSIILLGVGLLVAVLAFVGGWFIFPAYIQSKVSQVKKLFI